MPEYYDAVSFGASWENILLAWEKKRDQNSPKYLK